MYPNISNISPSTWGKTAWKFIHSVALTYPNNPSDTEKQAMENFIFSLQYLLPCAQCRNNFKLELQKYPLGNNIKNKQSLNVWLTKVHNEVNKRLGAPIMTEENVIELVVSDLSKDTKTISQKNSFTLKPGLGSTCNVTVTIVSGVVLIIGVILIVLGAVNYSKKRGNR